jgi:hypothetical protein
MDQQTREWFQAADFSGSAVIVLFFGAMSAAWHSQRAATRYNSLTGVGAVV